MIKISSIFMIATVLNTTVYGMEEKNIIDPMMTLNKLAINDSKLLVEKQFKTTEEWVDDCFLRLKPRMNVLTLKEKAFVKFALDASLLDQLFREKNTNLIMKRIELISTGSQNLVTQNMAKALWKYLVDFNNGKIKIAVTIPDFVRCYTITYKSTEETKVLQEALATAYGFAIMPPENLQPLQIILPEEIMSKLDKASKRIELEIKQLNTHQPEILSLNETTTSLKNKYEKGLSDENDNIKYGKAMNGLLRLTDYVQLRLLISDLQTPNIRLQAIIELQNSLNQVSKEFAQKCLSEKNNLDPLAFLCIFLGIYNQDDPINAKYFLAFEDSCRYLQKDFEPIYELMKEKLPAYVMMVSQLLDVRSKLIAPEKLEKEKLCELLGIYGLLQDQFAFMTFEKNYTSLLGFATDKMRVSQNPVTRAFREYAASQSGGLSSSSIKDLVENFLKQDVETLAKPHAKETWLEVKEEFVNQEIEKSLKIFKENVATKWISKN